MLEPFSVLVAECFPLSWQIFSTWIEIFWFDLGFGNCFSFFLLNFINCLLFNVHLISAICSFIFEDVREKRLTLWMYSNQFFSFRFFLIKVWRDLCQLLIYTSCCQGCFKGFQTFFSGFIAFLRLFTVEIDLSFIL